VRYRSKEEVEFGDFYLSALVPASQVHPIFPQHLTRAPDHLLAQHYIKEPHLLLFEPSCPTHLGDLLLEEATIWRRSFNVPTQTLSDTMDVESKMAASQAFALTTTTTV
jgi:hypothetical protein